MTIIKQRFTITYEREIDTDTGEIVKTTVVDTSDTITDNMDTDTEPKVYLEDSKLRLNSKALELLKVKAGDRIDVQYGNSNPLIGSSAAFGDDSAGCKLTKTNTIPFKGNKREVLAMYGTEFFIKPSEKDGQFVLASTIQPEEDENVSTEDIDIDLDSLFDGDQKISTSMFQL